MLKPYIVEKGIVRIIGQSVSFGGNRIKTGEMGDLFGNLDAIFKAPNRVDDRFLGISIDFWQHNDNGGRTSYMVGVEVSSLHDLPFEMESKAIPASRWVYIPVRYDDEEVKALAPIEKQKDNGYLTGCVFKWGQKWIVDNGYTAQDFPELLEIYGLFEGYAFPDGDGANITLAIPIV